MKSCVSLNTTSLAEAMSTILAAHEILGSVSLADNGELRFMGINEAVCVLADFVSENASNGRSLITYSYTNATIVLFDSTCG